MIRLRVAGSHSRTTSPSIASSGPDSETLPTAPPASELGGGLCLQGLYSILGCKIDAFNPHFLNDHPTELARNPPCGLPGRDVRGELSRQMWDHGEVAPEARGAAL